MVGRFSWWGMVGLWAVIFSLPFLTRYLFGELSGANRYIVPLVMGSTVGLAYVAIVSLFLKQQCPSCGTKLPTIRMPKNSRQWAWGGQTCSNCGAEMDWRGRLRKTSSSTS